MRTLASSAAAAVWLLPGLVGGVAIDAWIVEGLEAPQVVMYDDATGNIYYSLCNSSGTPVWPGDNSTAFDLRFAPMNGTGVAGFGYTQEENGVVVSS